MCSIFKFLKHFHLKTLLIKFLILIVLFFVQPAFAFHESIGKKLHHKSAQISKRNIKYGTASFYADKFLARSTASGEKYHHGKYTAACNVFPLNQWIKVTNLRNRKSVILKINDRLSRKSKRIVDVSQSAAQMLGFIANGITKVKVELLKNYCGN
jgi:rare lipoprotein A